MTDLLQNVPVSEDTMIDLYAETGIAVGTRIKVMNIGAQRLRLYTKATEPSRVTDGYIILTAFTGWLSQCFCL